MEVSNRILSELVIYDKYAKYIPELKRKETWEEIVGRNMYMHIEKYPQLEDKIKKVYKEYVLPKKVLPSMRSMQFAGVPIIRNPSRIYNCAYMPIDHRKSFSELMFLLLGGTGVGYSVQWRHVSQLPVVQGVRDGKRPSRFVVGDSIEGWSDAVKVLFKSYFEGKNRIAFDFSDIRPKGSPLKTTGGRAPGPGPLRACLLRVEEILHEAVGRQLKTIEVHDICCHLADAVLSGGIRRAAMIALFDKDDVDMLTCKAGNWWERNPQRGRANNSIILLRGSIDEDEFFDLWDRVKNSGSGEPGFYWTNNLDWGCNPCGEIALKPYQFCNLTTINVSDVTTQEELNARSQAGAFIGTLQAGYTNFHYLRPIWQETTEKDALLGVSQTGIASGRVLELDLQWAAEMAVDENVQTAYEIKINPASRTTTIKPEGTASLVCGSSSGIHAWHSPFYLRRMRVLKNQPIYRYLLNKLPEYVEDSYYSPENEAVIVIPQKAPNGSVFRDEPVENIISRTMRYNREWIRGGYVEGENNNNVSATISVRDNEWDKVGKLLWRHRNDYNGITVLPYDGGTYVQTPFEDCTEYMYRKLSRGLQDIDLSEVKEEEDTTQFVQEAACAGGVCSI